MKEWEERWRKGGKQVHTDSSVCHRMRFVSPACSLFIYSFLYIRATHLPTGIVEVSELLGSLCPTAFTAKTVN